MNEHTLLRGRTRIFLLIAVILIGGHGIILYYFSSNLALSAAAIWGVTILVVIKRLGWLGRWFVVFRRRSRPDAP